MSERRSWFWLSVLLFFASLGMLYLNREDNAFVVGYSVFMIAWCSWCLLLAVVGLIWGEE